MNNKTREEWLVDPLILSLDEKDRDLYAGFLSRCKTESELNSDIYMVERAAKHQKESREYHEKLERLKAEGYKWCVTYFPSYLGSPQYFKTLFSAKRYAESAPGEVWLDPIDGKMGGTYWANKLAGKYRCYEPSDYIAPDVIKSIKTDWFYYILGTVLGWGLLVGVVMFLWAS